MKQHDAFEQRRIALRDRRRRIIFNNDGCDVFAVPVDREPTAENLLAMRTHNLADTHVDVISYTTVSSGFSLFTHNTAVGEILTRKHPTLGNNIAPALIEQGRDCLEIMVAFGHEHDMEVFWSMRMNDTHDGAHTPENPYFLFPRLKQEHPEYLMGTPDHRPQHGAWSAVDYAHPQIRDLAYCFVEEVCQKYDVDGVELDFFRHPVFLRSVASGKPASREERGAMTDLIRRISEMCGREGRRRDRPILLAVRTPDSLDYCRDIGLDLATWLSEGLVDIHVPSGYFRLNPWQYSVENAHTHNVRVWAGLSESRVGGGHHRHPGRASGACYRARALNAWQAGVDAVYLFNLFDPTGSQWRELGNPDLLQTKTRTYFASYRGRRNAAGGNLPYDPYFNLPDLNPDNPAPLPCDVPYRTTITLSGQDLREGTKDSPQTVIELRLVVDSEHPDPADFDVMLNGKRLKEGIAASGAIAWHLAPELVKCGDNTVALRRTHPGAPSVLQDLRVDIRHGDA